MIQAFLKKLIRVGDLKVRLPNGKVLAYGDGTAPRVSVAVSSWAATRAIATDPQGGLGDAYMNGELTFQEGDIWDLLDLGGRNLPDRSGERHGPLQMMLLAGRRRMQQWNDKAASKSNVAHH